MAEVTYTLGEAEFDWSVVPDSHHIAIVCANRADGMEATPLIVRRTRSNGQTFDLTYRDEPHARRGLAFARVHYPRAELYRRPA